jgi:hypothetical protein
MTLAPAVLAAFAVLTTGTVVARAAASAGSSDKTPEAFTT